jgi:hypothetical protein
MPIYTNEDVKDWTTERKKEVHEWCFNHDYGNCDLCVLNNLYENKTKSQTEGGGE